MHLKHVKLILGKVFPLEKAQKHVFRLQVRIAKAMREGRIGKVKALQRLLTNSFYAKFLAVKQVTSNDGKNTPGIDGKLWRTNLQKIKAVKSIKRRGYKPLPLRRIYIPKKQGKRERPISIPAMQDRAMQAIWLLALSPVAEMMADPNAYGFRVKRLAQDAIEQCFIVLSKRCSPQFVLEGDIKSCFDTISHDWLMKNIIMDKTILNQFLKAHYVEQGKLHPVDAGIPQGGVISPCLTLIALSGLEKLLKSNNEKIRNKEKINLIAYADDFIITATNEELLNNKVIPIVEKFLAERGLELSKSKTKITYIRDGFDFLGFHIRKYKDDKFLIKPAKSNIKSFVRNTKRLIKSNMALPTDRLIYLLNDKITGWTNYYKTVVSSVTFSYVDHNIYKAIDSWINHRHSNKSKSWKHKKYFTTHRLNNWRFHANVKDKDGNAHTIYLKRASNTKIKRHVKIRGATNLFDPQFKDYFENLEKRRKSPSYVSSLGGLTPPYQCPSRMLGN